jgi:dienelactone hydrolase
VLRLDAWGETRRPAELRLLDSEPGPGYTRRKVAYEALPGNWVVAYLLVPDDLRGRAPAALCAHGHVKGAKRSVADPELALGVAYGHELARRGVVVLAPDNAGQGERNAVPEKGEVAGCDLLFRRLNLLGLDLTGLRIFELQVGLSLLASLPEVDGARIGGAGLSGGCWLVQVLAALDDRVGAVVLSGYVTTFAQTSWHGHCVCHHPRGIGELCEMHDLSALIAPRPQFVEWGDQDTSRPLEPAFSQIRRAYDLVGAGEGLALDVFPGGHLFHGARSLPWLAEKLGAR